MPINAVCVILCTCRCLTTAEFPPIKVPCGVLGVFMILTHTSLHHFLQPTFALRIHLHRLNYHWSFVLFFFFLSLPFFVGSSENVSKTATRHRLEGFCAGVLMSAAAVCSQWLIDAIYEGVWLWGGKYIVCVMEENFTLKLLYDDQIVIFLLCWIYCLLENLESFSPAPVSFRSTAKPFTLLPFVCSDTDSLFLWKHSLFDGSYFLKDTWWRYCFRTTWFSHCGNERWFHDWIQCSFYSFHSSFHSFTLIIPIMCL